MSRDEAGLRDAIATIARLAQQLMPTTADRYAIEAVNLATVAALIASAAEMRTESRGCHSRLDFPERNDVDWRRSRACGAAGAGYRSIGVGKDRSEPSVRRARQSDEIIALALAEDLGVDASWFLDAPPGLPDVLARDATTWSLVAPETRFEGSIVARGARRRLRHARGRGSLRRAVRGGAGSPTPSRCSHCVAEGSVVRAGTVVAEVAGPMVAVLAGERTALDFLMILSGIASEARRWQDAAGERPGRVRHAQDVAGTEGAVEVRGARRRGTNHRMGLFDMVLVKDNHRALAGGVAEAVARAQSRASRAAHRDRGRHARRRGRRGRGGRGHGPARQHGRRCAGQGREGLPRGGGSTGIDSCCSRPAAT